MQNQNTTTYADPSLIKIFSDRAFVVQLMKKPLSALGNGFLRFVCPTAQINQYSKKKKYLRSKMFDAVFSGRREVYADPDSDSRRAL